MKNRYLYRYTGFLKIIPVEISVNENFSLKYLIESKSEYRYFFTGKPVSIPVNRYFLKQITIFFYVIL